MDAGLVGAIAGGAIGVLGGVIGTYFTIKNAQPPRERALAIRLAGFCWIWLAGLAAWMFLVPRPWNQAALVMNLPILMAIPRMNRALAEARASSHGDMAHP